MKIWSFAWIVIALLSSLQGKRQQAAAAEEEAGRVVSAAAAAAVAPGKEKSREFNSAECLRLVEALRESGAVAEDASPATTWTDCLRRLDYWRAKLPETLVENRRSRYVRRAASMPAETTANNKELVLRVSKLRDDKTGAFRFYTVVRKRKKKDTDSSSTQKDTDPKFSGIIVQSSSEPQRNTSHSTSVPSRPKTKSMETKSNSMMRRSTSFIIPLVFLCAFLISCVMIYYLFYRTKKRRKYDALLCPPESESEMSLKNGMSRDGRCPCCSHSNVETSASSVVSGQSLKSKKVKKTKKKAKLDKAAKKASKKTKKSKVAAPKKPKTAKKTKTKKIKPRKPKFTESELMEIREKLAGVLRAAEYCDCKRHSGEATDNNLPISRHHTPRPHTPEKPKKKKRFLFFGGSKKKSKPEYQLMSCGGEPCRYDTYNMPKPNKGNLKIR